MKLPPLHIVGSLIFNLLAGIGLYLMLLNRFLIHLPDSKSKSIINALMLVLFVCASIAIGFKMARPPWIYASVAVLALFVVGEARRAYVRHTCAGSPPIDSRPHDVSLSSPVTTTDLVSHRYEVVHPKWSADPVRVVHITDMHVHPDLPEEYYQHVLELAEQAQPDFVFYTGDFVSDLGSLPKLRAALRPIGKYGDFAVLGNHDYWLDPDAIRSVIAETGVTLLTDESLTVTINSHEVVISGYDYPWGGSTESVMSPKEEALHLVLSHTPDNIYKIADSSGDIVFSGHYHAGQIRAPILGSLIVPSIYGRRFDHGHFVVEGTHLFVSAGIGVGNPPLRIYCQPDIFLVDISAK